MMVQDQTTVLAVSLEPTIGRRPRAIVTTRGARALVVAARAMALRITAHGFGLFGPFNNLVIKYLSSSR